MSATGVAVRDLGEKRLGRVRAWGVGAVASLLVISIATWPWVRTHMQAVAVLKILGGQPVPAPIAATVAAPITITDINFSIPAGDGSQQMVRAREYMPTKKTDAPALVIFHGCITWGSMNRGWRRLRRPSRTAG